MCHQTPDQRSFFFACPTGTECSCFVGPQCNLTGPVCDFPAILPILPVLATNFSNSQTEFSASRVIFNQQSVPVGVFTTNTTEFLLYSLSQQKQIAYRTVVFKPSYANATTSFLQVYTFVQGNTTYELTFDNASRNCTKQQLSNFPTYQSIFLKNSF